MVVLTTDFLQRQLLDRFCMDHKVAYRKVMECNFVHMAMQVVADGQGATTLLRSLVDGHRRLVALPFPKPMSFNFQMCWRRDRYYSETMRALVELATSA